MGACLERESAARHHLALQPACAEIIRL